jgi:hypothetical protein
MPAHERKRVSARAGRRTSHSPPAGFATPSARTSSPRSARAPCFASGAGTRTRRRKPVPRPAFISQGVSWPNPAGPWFSPQARTHGTADGAGRSKLPGANSRSRSCKHQSGHDRVETRAAALGVKQPRSALPTTTSRIPACVIRTRIPLVTPRVLVGPECRCARPHVSRALAIDPDSPRSRRRRCL